MIGIDYFLCGLNYESDGDKVIIDKKEIQKAINRFNDLFEKNREGINKFFDKLDKFNCPHCNKEANYKLSHNWSWGGSHNVALMSATCYECNQPLRVRYKPFYVDKE